MNATSADAMVRFECDGRIEAALIEWKYTESYGNPIDPSGHETRTRRYSDKVFSPHGPIRPDLGVALEDFFWEPFYQLLREQMLAWHMEKAREDGAERVTLLHIAPRSNRALHRVTSPALTRFGDDACAVFRSLLREPDRFVSRATEDVFGPLLAEAHDDPAIRQWAEYLNTRYPFLTVPVSAEA